MSRDGLYIQQRLTGPEHSRHSDLGNQSRSLIYPNRLLERRNRSAGATTGDPVTQATSPEWDRTGWLAGTELLPLSAFYPVRNTENPGSIHCVLLSGIRFYSLWTFNSEGTLECKHCLDSKPLLYPLRETGVRIMTDFSFTMQTAQKRPRWIRLVRKE